jgi:SAM-dependent methyltransferase
MNSKNLAQIYEKRFSGHESYRNKVWKILVGEFFSKWVETHHHILDLGCGYGEFINNINCQVRHAMDLNPKTRLKINDSVFFHEQDCSKPWNLEPHSLDIVFTSNFFEHLPNKFSLDLTIEQIRKALKPGGILIAMGPNIAVLKGQYWDFWDHHVALSDSSIQELLEIHNFSIEENVPKFLPYNMVRVKEYPLYFLSIYLKIPFLWKILGKQFLIIGKK